MIKNWKNANSVKAEYEAGVADGIKTATENIKREDALSLVDLELVC